MPIFINFETIQTNIARSFGYLFLATQSERNWCVMNVSLFKTVKLDNLVKNPSKQKCKDLSLTYMNYE